MVEPMGSQGGVRQHQAEVGRYPCPSTVHINLRETGAILEMIPEHSRQNLVV